jgi:hypothetical protein
MEAASIGASYDCKCAKLFTADCAERRNKKFIKVIATIFAFLGFNALWNSFEREFIFIL